MIRTIMVVIGIILLLAALVFIGFLTVKYWDVAWVILICVDIVNLMLWVYACSDDSDVDPIFAIWTVINITLHTAGLFWIWVGLCALWDKAGDIDFAIEEKIDDIKEKKQERKHLGELKKISPGSLSIAEKQAGELSINGK